MQKVWRYVKSPYLYISNNNNKNTHTMKNYLRNLISEKEGISMNTPIEVEGSFGINFMTVETIVEHILIAPKREQEAIRTMLVKIDFHNASVLDYFKHLAKALAR